MVDGDALFAGAIVGLVILGGFAVYLVLQAVPLLERQQAQAAFVQNLSAGLPSTAGQFYPNMRFTSPTVVYSFAQTCSSSKQQVVLDSFRILEHQTPLRFTTQGTPSFFINCANLEISGDQADHFVAGEGGPSKTINASTFYLIQVANVSLYRDEMCDTPHIALHEVLHALGFDHTNNPQSIMYPVTDCAQTLDPSIPLELSRLYAIPSFGDLVLTDANVSIANGYLNFVATVANYGLADIMNATLVVEGDQKRTFTVGEIGIGKRKILSVDNIRTAAVEHVTFTLLTDQAELSVANNQAVLMTKESLNSGETSS
jgi:hypothetical protein